MAVIAVYRFVMMGGDPGPPGSDGGNWLAYTNGLFGESDKAAESVYFPGVLAALKALLIFLPELVALKTLAVLSSVLVAVPFYYLVRYVSERLVAAFLTTLLLMSGMLIEIMTYGGYPHLLAAAYMVASLFFLDRWLASARQADLLWSAGCAALVIFTNHFTRSDHDRLPGRLCAVLRLAEAGPAQAICQASGCLGWSSKRALDPGTTLVSQVPQPRRRARNDQRVW